MNVFASYSCPVKSARLLDDQRVVKMSLESFQMLSTALRLKGYDDPLLARVTHQNHPCAIWARHRRENFEWLYEHMLALDEERIQRWNRDEPCKSVVRAKKFKMHKYAKEFDRGWSEWANCARHQGLGIDFTHLPVNKAYRKYLTARWRHQQKQVEAGKPLARLPICTIVGLL